MPMTLSRPAADEYLAYYERYISLVPDGNLIDLLVEQQRDTMRTLRAVDDERGLHAYAAGKWTIKEVIGHLSDAERIFAYRALRFARGDAQPLAGFDENAYAPAGRFNERPICDLVDEFQAIRASTVHLFRHLNEEEMARRGLANGNAISVRALGYVIAGHERHHVTLLRERYGI
ncbi:MAG: DinB family protein [Gemmatimonadaceae bacterium]